MTSSAVEYDFLGVGFGPSNLALAVAIEEGGHAQGSAFAGAARARYAFIERKPEFVWHGGMLLDDTDMQISFLKDLATLRNPRSPYTFINYLHQRGRLESFINLKTFFPSRHEFNDYLSWVAGHFQQHCHYGEEVIEILPESVDGTVQRLRVRSRDGRGIVHERLARGLVIGMGGEPQLPDAFAACHDPRVVHSSGYLEAIGPLGAGPAPASAPRRIAVVGGGQSAAEVFVDLTRRYPHAEVTMLMRGAALKPSDDSPFVNEIFSPGFTDFIYRQPEERRRLILREYRNTNYSVVDLDLIERIYQMLYQQKVTGEARHALLGGVEIRSATPMPQGIACRLRGLDGEEQSRSFDLVVLATGYRRDTPQRLLSALAPWLDGEYRVDRHYRLCTSPRCQARIFLQGCCEDSHGLSDTLLSVLAVRSHEIAQAIFSPESAHRLDPHSIAAPANEEGRAVYGVA